MKQLVVVPVYNEEEYVSSVLDSIRNVYRGDILAVNDGSTDKSAKLIEERKDVIRITHQQNLGYGRSLIDGFNFALEKGYELLVTIDCDEQHQPHLIPELFDKIYDTDVYSGSRYLRESSQDDDAPEDRYKINKMVTRKINRLTGFNLTDSFCGMKGYRVEALRCLDLKEKGYAFPIEFWIQAYHCGLSVREFPIKRIYKNLDRSFSKELDDPQIRLDYYNKVFNREVLRWSISLPLELTRTT